MYIKIEEDNKTVRSINTSNGQRFIAEQPALMFKDHENYPDKCTLTLAFSDKEHVANNATVLAPGDYEPNDRCFSVNRFNSVDFQLRPEHLVIRKNSLSKAS